MVLTHARVRMHACTHAHTTHMKTHMKTRTHIRTHTHTHAHTHAHAHAHRLRSRAGDSRERHARRIQHRRLHRVRRAGGAAAVEDRAVLADQLRCRHHPLPGDVTRPSAGLRTGPAQWVCVGVCECVCECVSAHVRQQAVPAITTRPVPTLPDNTTPPYRTGVWRATTPP